MKEDSFLNWSENLLHMEHVNTLPLSLRQDPRLLPLQLRLQPLEHHQHPPTGHLLSRGQEGNAQAQTYLLIDAVNRREVGLDQPQRFSTGHRKIGRRAVLIGQNSS